MTEKMSLHGENAVAISRKTCEKLILEPDGNAARLWLLLASEGELSRSEAAARLAIRESAVSTAYAALARAGLCGPNGPEPEVPADLTIRDVRDRKETDRYFTWLLAYAEQTIGRTLSANDTVALLRVCDRYGLLPDTVPILLRYCADRADPDGTTGRRTTMYQVERTAAEWEREGVDTPEKADAYVKKTGESSEKVRAFLRAQNVFSTTPAVERTVAAWIATGLPADVLQYACDLTVTKTGSMKWTYADSIIRSWIAKGLRTLREIKREEPPAGTRKTADKTRRDAEEVERQKEAIRRAEERANGGKKV